MISAAAVAPKALWYLTRGTGTISLILLTLVVALGVANVRRSRTPNIPRFVFDAVHRNAALLAVTFLFAHIATSLLDGFAPIALLDVVIPFRSAYRPLWLGFGAVAFDLLIAITITSLLRRRLGYRAWRATHWAAYASWPVAVLHGMGTGTDIKYSWMLAITGGCVVTVVVAVIARATAGWPHHTGARSVALTASALVPLGLIVWLPSGPLAAGWAKRAGTPSSVLAAAVAGTGPSGSGSFTSSESGSSGSSGPSASGGSAPSFSAPVTGSVHQGRRQGGLEEVHISLVVAGQHLDRAGIRIFGRPAAGGGVSMTSSRAALGTADDPGQYRGAVTALNGTTVELRVSHSGGAAIKLLAQLQIDANTGAVTGTLTAGPAGG